MSDIQKFATGLLWTMFVVQGVALAMTYTAVATHDATFAAIAAGGSVLLGVVIGAWMRDYDESFG